MCFFFTVFKAFYSCSLTSIHSALSRLLLLKDSLYTRLHVFQAFVLILHKGSMQNIVFTGKSPLFKILVLLAFFPLLDSKAVKIILEEEERGKTCSKVL